MMWGLEAYASKQNKKLVSESEKREEQRAKRQKERGAHVLPKGKGREQRMRRSALLRGCKSGKRCKLAAERKGTAAKWQSEMRSKALQGPSPLAFARPRRSPAKFTRITRIRMLVFAKGSGLINR